MVGGTTQPFERNTNKIARQRDFEPKIILAKVLLQRMLPCAGVVESTAEDGIEGCVRDDDDQDGSSGRKSAVGRAQSGRLDSGESLKLTGSGRMGQMMG